MRQKNERSQIAMKKFFQNEWARMLMGVTALCLLSLAPSFFALAQGLWPFDDDAIALFGPWREWTRSVLWSGVLPLWNPHLFLGMPFMSNGQTSVLYAPNSVYWLVPIRGAMIVDALFHGVILGAGGYALARALYRSQSAAWLCALCLMLGSGVATHLSAGHLTWHAARAYLPWLLWALVWFLRKRQSKYTFALAIFFALQLLAGYPPYVLWSACWCIVFVCAWSWAARIPVSSMLRLLCSRRVLMPGVLLLLLSCAVVLPLRETSALSTHGAEIPYEIAVSPSSTFYGWMRLALPNFFGGNRGAQWSIEKFPHEEAAYIGLLPLALALLAPFLARAKNQTEDEIRASFERRFTLALWLILPIALVLALGDHTPVYRWLYDALPPLRMFRVPARWLEIWFFAACVLAAFGWDAVFRLSPQRKKNVFAGIAIFAMLLFAVALTLNFWPDNSRLWLETAQWTKRSLHADFADRLQYASYLKSTALQSVALALGVLLGALILMMRYRDAAPRAKLVWQKSALVLIACDLLIVFWSSARFARDDWPKNPWPRGIENFYHSGDRWNTAFENEAYGYGLDQGLPREIDLLGGYDALASNDFFAFAGAIEKRHLWSSQYQATQLDPLWRAAGITHVFASNDSPLLSSLLHNGAKMIAKFGSGKKQMQLWRLPQSWPRVFLTSRVMRAAREDQLSILRSMSTGSTPGAVIDENAFHNFLLTQDAGSYELEWTRGNNFSSFQIQTAQPQILVESESLFPGWRAWLNGRPVKIERVNFLFRGVAVPGGKSRVAFIYDNQTTRFGIFLSLLGVGLATGVLSYSTARRRFRRSEKR
jgi:hypothetical protein